MGVLAFPRLGTYRSGMTLLAVGLALAALSVALHVSERVRRLSLKDTPVEIQAYDDTHVVDRLGSLTSDQRRLHAQYAEMQRWREDVSVAVAEGITHVDRVENRIRATVRRAQEKLAEHGYEHPGLEAEASELREVHGDRSEPSGLPPVQPHLEDDRDRYAGIPGHISDDSFLRLG